MRLNGSPSLIGKSPPSKGEFITAVARERNRTDVGMPASRLILFQRWLLDRSSGINDQACGELNGS
jgi:hypothetical protein